jgi:beta-phosphoglucomutase-like phosphatase (HAD superfamily)
VTLVLEPPADAAALLFDCDGTLVDTISHYRRCWRQVFGRHGFEMSDEWFAARTGLTMQPFITSAFPDLDDAARTEIIDEGMSMFMDLIHLVEPLDHVVAVARRFHGRLPMLVVSSGPFDAVTQSLAVADLGGLFDGVFTLADVELPKPSPEGYLLAIERLGLPASDCVAYEDSEPGFESALAAGIGTIFDVRTNTRVT